MPNMDTTQESTTSPVSLNACGSTAAGGTSYPGISDYEWTFSNGNPEITTTSCTATWQRPLSKLVPRQATFARNEIARSTGWLVWRLRQAI